MSELDDDPIQIAQEAGWRVDLPDQDQLFIDIDSEEDMEVYRQIKAKAGDNGVHFHDEQITPSMSGSGHYHIRVRVGGAITWTKLTPMDKIALQAALGSDRTRELLSALRILTNTSRPPTVFFEKEAKRRR